MIVVVMILMGTWMTERYLSDVCKNVTSLGQTPADHPMQMDCHICSKRRGREGKTTTYKCNIPMCVTVA